MSRDTKRIRHLNDRLRQDFLYGVHGDNSVVVTSGVIAMGDPFVKAAMRAVANYATFTPECDPWDEHNFGAMPIGPKTVLFKIDYFDLDMRFAAENPAVASQTKRVLTIMLQDEY